MDFDRFYFYDQVEEYLKKTAEEFPCFMQLSSLYTTENNRNIYLVKLMNFQSFSEEDMPGYYVQGGIHARECGAVTAALKLIDVLLHEKREMLSERIYYILPMINPDSMDLVMKTNMPIRSKYKDKIFNGITPKDMDGNGLILNMRIKNPHGLMKEDPECPGVMISRLPGETEGDFYDVTFEGELENDCDSIDTISFLNIDFNRSYPVGWCPKTYGGRYPLEEPEHRAIVSFLVSRSNIYGAVDLHCGQNAILRPHIKADKEYPVKDLELMKSVAELGQKITGFPAMRCDEYSGGAAWSIGGNFNMFAYDTLGISSYVIEMGNGFNDAGYDTRDYLAVPDKSVLLRDVKKNNPDVFVPWKKYPQLGEVEIGGFIDGKAYYMRPDTMAKVCPRTAEFMIEHSRMEPKFSIDNVDLAEISCNVYRVRCEIMNVGRMNTTVMEGASSAYAERKVIAGLGGSTEFEVLNKHQHITKKGLAPLETIECEWFVKTEDICKLCITAKHPKAKNAIYQLA